MILSLPFQSPSVRHSLWWLSLRGHAGAHLPCQCVWRHGLSPVFKDSRDPTDPIFSPSISPTPTLIEIEGIPSVPVLRVVLPDRSLKTKRKSPINPYPIALHSTHPPPPKTHPLSFRNIRSPSLPMLLIPIALIQSVLLYAGIPRPHGTHQPVPQGLSIPSRFDRGQHRMKRR